MKEFCVNVCVCQKIVVPLQSQRLKQQKLTKMEAVKQKSYDWYPNVMERPIIDPNWREQPSYSRKEFMDELARRVGSHYGLADIRDAQ